MNECEQFLLSLNISRFWLFALKGLHLLSQGCSVQHVLGRFKQSIFLRYCEHLLKRSSIVSHTAQPFLFCKDKHICLHWGCVFFNDNTFFHQLICLCFCSFFGPFSVFCPNPHDFVGVNSYATQFSYSYSSDSGSQFGAQVTSFFSSLNVTPMKWKTTSWENATSFLNSIE